MSQCDVIKSARPQKFGCIKKISKNPFFAEKNRRNMGFLQDFWLNKSGNDESHLHSNFEAHILSNI